MPLQSGNFTEIMLRSAFIGEKIMYDDVAEEISNINFEPKTNQVTIETVSGKSFPCHIDEEHEFDLAATYGKIKPANERLAGV